MGGLLEYGTEHDDALRPAIPSHREPGISSSRKDPTPRNIRAGHRTARSFSTIRGNRGFEAVSITTQPTFAFGNAVAVPKLLRMGPAGSRTNYDITPGGRFMGLVTAGEKEYLRGSADQIRVVLNWTEELEGASASTLMRSGYRPRFTLTPTIARRGSTNTVG